MIDIPYTRAGKVVGHKFRTLEGEKKFYQAKGSEQCLYNVDAIEEAKGQPVVITEGEMDAAIALQCGFVAVSVPNGAPMQAINDGTVKYAYLKDIPEDADIILAFDADEAGAALFHDVTLLIKTPKLRFVTYPPECKDLNDVFLKFGADGVMRCINGAQSVKINGLYTMAELPPLPEGAVFDCPIPGMADLYKLRLGDFAVIVGVPGFGKTTAVNQIAFDMAQKHGWKVCFASFEQRPQTDHLRALRVLYAGRPHNLIGKAEREDADKFINERFVFIVPSLDDEVDLKFLLQKMRVAVLQYGANLIVIDPWNEIEHTHDPGMTTTQYVGFAIKQLKRFAAKYRVHLILVAHPAKMTRSKDGKYPMPSLYDCADSSHFYNKSDIGIIVHRESEYTVIKVAKCRYHNLIGKVGEVHLEFDDYKGRFVSQEEKK